MNVDLNNEFKTEIWRDIQGYEGYYQVSNMGGVRSVKKNIILKPYIQRRGYLCVSFSKLGRNQKFLVHRLVAIAFIENKENYPIINHKDENKNNNEVTNLEWCTYEYNSNYGQTQKKKVQSMDFEKIANGKKIPILQYDFDGNLIKEWTSAKDCAIEFGLGNELISKCSRGEIKSAYGYLWRVKIGETPISIDPYIKNENKIVQLNLDGIVIKIWRSISEAGRELNLDTSSISKCIRGKLNKVGGFIWKKYEVVYG